MSARPAQSFLRTPRRSLSLGIAAVAAACAVPCHAHVLSVSNGSLQAEDDGFRYVLRIPLLEVPDTEEPQRTLLDSIRLLHDGREARRTGDTCQEDPGQGLLVCQAEYRFDKLPEQVEVECDLPAVTVPHHIHILRSGEGEAARQTVFDITSSWAEVRFTPPTRWEALTTEVETGARRAITSPELLLFLIALALAGRSRREFLTCIVAFLSAQAVVAALANALGWIPPARFLEAAAALTVGYFASEILFLPDSRDRWLVSGGLGCFHGLFLATFLQSTGMRAEYLLPGSLASEGLLAAALAALRLRFVRGRTETLLAILLLVGGLSWFGLRLIE